MRRLRPALELIRELGNEHGPDYRHLAVVQWRDWHALYNAAGALLGGYSAWPKDEGSTDR